MKLELDTLTTAELIALNKETARRLRTNIQVESMKAAMSFNKGNKVKITNSEKRAGEIFDVLNVGRTRAKIADATGKEYLCYLANLEQVKVETPEVKAEAKKK